MRETRRRAWEAIRPSPKSGIIRHAGSFVNCRPPLVRRPFLTYASSATDCTRVGWYYPPCLPRPLPPASPHAIITSCLTRLVYSHTAGKSTPAVSAHFVRLSKPSRPRIWHYRPWNDSNQPSPTRPIFLTAQCLDLITRGYPKRLDGSLCA